MRRHTHSFCVEQDKILDEEISETPNEEDDLLEIHLILSGLAAQGEVLPACPTCEIYLDLGELSDLECKKCGKIDIKDLIWYPVSKQGN